MNTSNIDPDLLPAIMQLESVLGEGACLDLDDLPTARGIVSAMENAARSDSPNRSNVTVELISIHDKELNIDVELKIYKSRFHTEVQPAILYLHGGGYVLGAADHSYTKLSSWCEELGVSIISVEYRLAPEHPFPAALFDCFAALKWLFNYAKEMNIDKKNIAIVGESAGGGLAAGLSLYARDHSHIEVAFQCLIYPMIDHTNVEPADTSHADTVLWSRANNKLGWQAYLGDGVAESMLQYAAPSTARDLSNLPSTYLCVGDQDLFYIENKLFAKRLKSAGVDAKFEAYIGGFHAFATVDPNTTISQRFNENLLNALREALHPLN